MKNKDLDNKEEFKFTKEQLISSKKYIGKKDVLYSILEDKKLYSFSEVDTLIKKFMKGKVK